eukprot:TRINITY_DN67440_c0_g1_i1.p1 TRINITY_DN67440_c0_g1~~TRINITY_DN67440_c0_g1_i1.p1  ORF type:complete len:424 (+),score=38.15 TRINITY_DN67440_c0_g1_i1:24-1274(+)
MPVMKLWCLLLASSFLRAQSQDEDHVEEEHEKPPAGYQVKGLASKIPLEVSPFWNLFLGFSDKDKTIDGKMSLSIFYQTYASDVDPHSIVDDPAILIDIDNFAAGNKQRLGSINLVDGNDEEAVSTSIAYTGAFSQAAGEFDMICYPFDSKMVTFNISIQKPGDYAFELLLGCSGGTNVTAKGRSDGKQIITKCTRPVTKPFVGFQWGDFVCRRVSRSAISCSLIGRRQWEPIFQAYIVPSIVVSTMGYSGFLLEPTLAVPRVSVTMLAMLSLITMRNQVLTIVPSSGSMSWLEEYFILSVTFMLLNLLGHVLGIRIHSSEMSECRDLKTFVNRTNLTVVASIFVLVVIAKLHERNCENIDSSVSGALVGVAAAIFVLNIVRVVLLDKGTVQRFARSALNIKGETQVNESQVVPYN